MSSHSFFFLVIAILGKYLRAALPCWRGKKKTVDMLASTSVIEANTKAYGEMRALAGPDEDASFATALIGPHNTSFPTVISVVLQDSFAYPLLGSLHMSSNITIPSMSRLLRAIGVQSPANDATARRPTGGGNAAPVATSTQIVTATWMKEQDRLHKRGIESLFNVKLLEGESSLWESRTKILFFQKHKKGDAPPSSSPPMLTSPTLPLVSSVRLPSPLPKEWTRLTGDSNPIHVWWPFAWALGFRSGMRVVGHGMSVVFVSLPTITAALLKGSDAKLRDGSFNLEVSFLRPVFVPGSISVHVGERRAEGNGRLYVEFELVSGSTADSPTSGKIAIRGRLSVS
jgi:acyl dehydratase